MKNLMIIGLILVLLVSWGLVTPKKSDADPLTLFGLSMTFGLIGGSILSYNQYPECRKEESMGAMGECVKKAKQDKEKEEEILAESKK